MATAQETHGSPFCAAVDWGTSSFRLWLLDADGETLADSRGPEGMMYCADHGFEPVLKRHLAAVDAPQNLPVVICGMAGARQGWLEAPYVETPARLGDIATHAVRVEAGWADIRILPGIAQTDPKSPNVMRGEETQLLGAVGLSSSALLCMPGTHSKWVEVAERRVERFATFMTGELFSVIGTHTILRHAGADKTDQSDIGTFDAALDRVLSGGTGFSSLFEVRAARLLGFAQPDTGSDHLSGLLIGSEIADARQIFGTNEPVKLIASGKLGERYERALKRGGFSVTRIEADDVVRAGLFLAATTLWKA